MFLIEQISSEPLQTTTLILPNSEQISMTIYFVPMQYGWFITNLVYGDFVLNSLRITNNPNMLYQWKNIIPFGLACFSKSDREPSFAEDFSSGASKLYLLSTDEVVELSEMLGG